MRNRVVGLAVILLTLAGAVVLGSSRAKPLAGTAVVQDLGAVPTVGECVTELVRDQHPGYAVPTPCTGQWEGEVVAIINGSNDPDADDAQCQQAADTYLGGAGVVAVPASSGRDALMWRPSSSISAMSIVPDRLQHQFGAAWTVCVVMSGNYRDRGYRTSLRDANSTSSIPPEAGVCLSGEPKESIPVVSCDVPHVAEMLASVDGAAAADVSVLDDSCARLSAASTKMDDPTAAGRLRTRAIPAFAEPEGSYLCLVEATAGRELTASIRELGGSDLPIK